MEYEKFKNTYMEMQKKYDLPSYDELDEEFELLYFQRIIEIKYPLRFVRRRIVDKLNPYVDFLQNILNPNPNSLISLEESKFFSKEEKEEIIALTKEIIVFERKSLMIDIKHDEKEDAEFIKESFKACGNFSSKVGKISEQLKKGWEDGAKEEGEKHYFG